MEYFKLHDGIKDVLEELKHRCKKAGSQGKWARANGLSVPHVSDVLRGKKKPGAKICKALGINIVVSYYWSGDRIMKRGKWKDG